jgi:hypothetical protein
VKPLIIELELIGDEVGTVASALWDYRVETEGYLRNYDVMLDGHDDCCEVARARRGLREREKVSLEQRLALINSVLARVDPASVPPLGSGDREPTPPGTD